MSTLKRSRTYSLIPTQSSSDAVMVSAGSAKKRSRKTKYRITAIPGQIIAQSVMANLTYSESTYFTSATGVPNVFVWNLNSVYDPNRTGTGHQPKGFDQYAALYSKYRVTKVKYTVYLSNQTSYDSAVCVAPTNFLLSSSMPPDVMNEFPGAQFEYCPRVTVGLPKELKGSVDLAKLTGRDSKSYLADDIYASDVATSPSELMMLNIAIQDVTGAQSVTVYYNIKLQYQVLFFDPKDPGQS
ncbi:MAG: putative capsid protein [Cressdnaviricota sp.]|nr:MAG: putative capsid protein [Cressdnaviricota sp.]